jgi:hypothetical protein
MACTARPLARGAMRDHTPERSPLFRRTSRRGWRWRYHGGGGARLGAQASTVEGSPTGQVGGGDSSAELLVNGRGENRTAAAFSDEVGAPVAGGVLHRGGKEEEAHAQVYSLKKVTRGGGARGSAHCGGGHDGGGDQSSSDGAVPRGELLHRQG